MKIIVDTNIVFSGILNSNGKIGELLIKSKDYFDFFSVDQLKGELTEHKEKIKKIGKYSEEEYIEARELAISKIRFIRDSLIPKENLIKAAELLVDIDIDDSIFLALALNFNAKLWTGDRELINGLKVKRIYKTITTLELYELYLKKEIK
jgi:predicted nucleic acid-binding protein